MPKERVYGEDLPVMEDGSEDPGSRPVVVVTWSREAGHVQIVTRLDDCEVSPPGQDILASYGFYVTLDRQAINGLIRNLRRARDQAFGRDE